MKFGILWHKSTQNIGDDIQAYASYRLLPQLDYTIDREHLDEFKSEDDEPVALVMSGWYMWQKWNWPPSKYIHPKFVGLHYTDGWRDHPTGKMPVGFEFLDGVGGDYLRAYAPIGCRDYSTMEMLDTKGIENYLSGCVTLTLDPPDIKDSKYAKANKPYICLVDLEPSVEKALKKKFENSKYDIRVIKHKYPIDNPLQSWEERKDYIEDVLDLYNHAHCVLTFRLHCLLPCLAMKTPVVLVRKSFNSIRFDPYHKWAYNISDDDIISGNYSYDFDNPPENPQDYLSVRNALKKDIEKFIEDAKNDTRTATEMVRTSYTENEVIKWRHDAMKKALSNWFIVTRNDSYRYNKLKKSIAKNKKSVIKEVESQSFTKNIKRKIKKLLSK